MRSVLLVGEDLLPANHIFSASFWKGYWVALRRMHRDPVALKVVLRVTAYFIYLCIYFGWLLRGVIATHDGETYFIFSFGAALGGSALLLVTIWNWKDTWLTRREAARTVNVIIRDQLRLEAFALATLLARASSEQMLSTKTLPPSIEVITRRSQLDRLRELKLLEVLPEQVQNLLLLPDGHWTHNKSVLHGNQSKLFVAFVGSHASIAS